MTYEEITDTLVDNPAATAVWNGGGANTLEVITSNSGVVSAAGWDVPVNWVRLDFTVPSRPGETFYARLYGEQMGDQWVFGGREFVDSAGEKAIF